LGEDAMKMNKSGFLSGLPTIVVSFLAGCLVASIGCFLFVRFSQSASKPVRVRVRENKQATAFFYRTANALFEGTYNSEGGSIKEHALNAFRQVASKHGNKCYVKIYDNESGYHGGVVFFPSGHLSHITIMPRTEQDFVITDFAGMDWDFLWSSELRSALPKPDEDESD
jgi:hypothetical protein